MAFPSALSQLSSRPPSRSARIVPQNPLGGAMSDAGDERRERSCERDGDGPAAAAPAGGPASDSGDGAVRDGPAPQKADDLASRIDALKQEQAELLAKKKQCAKDLRNAEKRRRRLKKKARTLSADDLEQLLAMRTADGEGETLSRTAARDVPKKKQKHTTE